MTWGLWLGLWTVAIHRFTELFALTHARNVALRHGAHGVESVTKHMSIVRDFVHFEETA